MNKIFVLIGPTATGKSYLSLKLSKDFPFEIINADLYSIYDELNIGSFELDIFEININKIKTYEGDLIKWGT